MYNGRGFRSGETVTKEFAGIEKKYKLELKRTIKQYDNKMNKATNFYTTIDQDYILRSILNNAKPIEEKKS